MSHARKSTHALNEKTRVNDRRNVKKKVTALVNKQHFCRFELMFDF